jgi:uncharacterized membrane protein
MIRLYLWTMGVLLSAEALWLGLVAGGLFRKEVGHLLRPEFRLGPAVAFYLIYVTGILVFAVLPGIEARQLHRSVALGAFLGLVAYSTFDLTSMAVFKGFPLRLAGVDILWGTCVTAAVSAAGYGMGRYLGVGD